MKCTDITVDFVKDYLRISNTDDDLLLGAILAAALQFAKTYTGLTMAEIDELADVPLAILALCADMYDVRQWTITSATTINPLVKQILDSHSMNLLEGMGEEA